MTGTPANADVGTTTDIVITVRDRDTGGLSASLPAFSIEVTNVNDAPTITGTPDPSVTQGAAYSFTPGGGDVDVGDTLVYAISNPPSWASFDTATGALTGTPANADVGNYENIVISVTDGIIATPVALPTFAIAVTNTNDAPTISGTPATSVAEDSAYSFTPTGEDADGDTLTFAITNMPSWASFDTATGALTGTPANADVGTTTDIVITVRDRDTGGLSASLPAFSIEVTNVNDAPTISGTPATSVAEDSAYSFTPTAEDADGDMLTWAITNMPSWASFDTATGALTGTPANADVGNYENIVISVTDGIIATPVELPAFAIEVTNTNDAPTITGTPDPSVTQGAAYSFTPGGGDVDVGDTLVYAISNPPSWASFDTATGALTGTPANADVGNYENIVITVTDGIIATPVALPTFAIAVTNANDAPTISGTPATTVAEDSAYSFTPTAEDADGDMLTYAITNMPSWATFDETSGVLTGTPTNADVGTTTDIVITVRDRDTGGLSASLPAFSIEVTNVNDAPTITGTPATSVAEDSAYSFTPTGEDADGDTLTFAITNMPSWASFDTATGALTGTPANADVGDYEDIVISVTDGIIATPVALPTFAIAVTNTNDAPTITGTPATTVAEDSAYSFTPTAEDADGDMLTYAITNMPSWASFDTATGALTGTPTNADVGNYENIVISVTDGIIATPVALPTFAIAVTNTNDAPTISGTPATTVAEDSLYTFTPTGEDVDTADMLRYAITNPPSWATFDETSGVLTGTPANADVGTTTDIVITVRDRDTGGLSASLPAFSIEVTNVNDAPTITGTPDPSVTQGAAYSFTPGGGDVDVGDTLVYAISNPPSWASFDTATGALTGTPANADVGNYENIVISVTDGIIATPVALPTFAIAVTNTNDAPTISGTPATSVAEDSLYTFTPTGEDVDTADMLRYAITNPPSWATFDETSGVLTGTPANADVGTTTDIVITVRDRDTGGLSASLPAFSIEVTNVNDAPTITGTPDPSVTQGAAYSFTPGGGDVDVGDTLVYAISNPPSWASFDTATGALTGTPANADVGNYENIVISVTDGIIATPVALPTFAIAVTNTNDAPTISGTPATSVAEDSAYSFTPTGEDADGDTLTFAITNMPSWASFDTATGALTGTPANADVGTTTDIVITVRDRDTGGLSASLPAFSIEVTNVNDAPTISGTPATSVAEDSAYSFTPTAEDADGDMLTWAITNMPSWASFDTATGALTGTPANADVGNYENIVISVTDGIIATPVELPAFAIEVTNTNDAPTITGTPDPSVTQGAAYSFTPGGGDVDVGDTLVYAISNPPSWASFDTATGALTGTPANADVGNYENIVITVTDGIIATPVALPTFAIAVTNANDAPTISGTPATTVAEDSAYSFTPTAEDADGDMLTYAITNMPSWATFDETSGVLTGTPTNADVGTTTDIVITVRDRDTGGLSASLPAFSIEVTNVNDAPTITGTPATSVAEDSAYSFTPTGEDADGDTLTFAITNMPSWASFDTATGALTGTPANADVGDYEDIVISVTDGIIATPVALPTFAIAVTNTNDAPTITGTPATTVTQGAAYSFTPGGGDVDVGDTLVYAISNPPSWASFDTATGALTGTPANADVGDYEDIVISVTDGIIATPVALPTFAIAVTNTNDAPTISGTPATTVAEDSLYTFTPTGEDVDTADMLRYAITNPPSWATFDETSGVLTGTPANADVGTTTDIVITVRDRDTGGLSASLPAFSIEVTNVNDAPTITGTPDPSVTQGAAYSFTPTGEDADGDTLTWAITNMPSWASFDTATGALTGTPANADVGNYENIVISVTDGIIATPVALPTFAIAVTNTNDAPTISGTPATTVAEDSLYTFTPTGEDVDTADMLRYAISNPPSWATFDETSGVLTGTPANADVGTTTDIVITVRDRDTGGLSASLPAFSIEVTNVNDAPTITGTPDPSVTQGAAYSFTPGGGDVDVGDTLVYAITNPPSWASFDTATGALTGTPANADVGNYENIVITVTDGIIATPVALPTFAIAVTNANDAPTISGTPATTVAEDSAYSFTPTGEDADGDMLTWAITNMPSWATFDETSGVLTGTPTNADVGTTTDIVITVRDRDTGGLSASLPAFSIEVTNVNDAPTITGTPATSVAEDSAYSFTPTGEDADGDTLTFAITNMPSWASFDTATGALTGTPANADVGDYEDIVISVTDGIIATPVALPTFAIAVTNTNDAPTITGTPATTVAEDSLYSFTPTGEDADGDTLTFAITNMPSWASFDTATGALTGTPANADVGTTTDIVITVRDRDTGGLSASLPAFSIEVTNVNDAPTITGTPDPSVTQGAAYSFTPTAEDADGDTLTWAITNMPSWASFDTATGALTGTPANADVGTTTDIVITVRDRDTGGLSASLPAFSIEVTNVNDAPTITGTPDPSVTQGAAYSFTPGGGDVDVGDTLVYAISNPPSWASFDTATGALTGTPANADVGDYEDIVISVTDGIIATPVALPTFAIAVTNTNDAPTISGTPATSVAEDSAYSFTPTGEDADGDTLTFAITNMPSWASFDTATGALTGTPANADVGNYENIVISVTDGIIATPVELPAFAIEVTNTNDAPTITGTPDPSVTQGAAYSFTPTGEDADGDTLTWAITNMPSWASFDTATGALTGTPANADVGNYENIVITVTDGIIATPVALPTFAIAVTNANDAPTISGTPATTVAEDSLYTFTPTGEDVDTADMLRYAITNPPSWATFDETSGVLTGTPTNADVGTTTDIVITVRDRDTGGLSASLPAFSIEVTNVNDAPTITGTPDPSVTQGAAYSFTPGGGDVDVGDTLVYAISNPPSWASFDTATGALTGTPANADVGNYENIVISVTDGIIATPVALPTFAIAVTNTNDAPTISGTPATSVAEDSAYSFTPTAEDADGDMLTWAITNMPSWASFDTATGALTGTPANADVGNYENIVISVTDGIIATPVELPAFAIEVTNTNDAPTITGTPDPSVTQGAAYSFTPGGGDVDVGDTLVYAISNPPSWASFDTATGALTGTPANADVGNYENIVITVTDGIIATPVALPTFAIAVTNANDAPTISGTPATTVAEDSLYTFTPTGEDVDTADMLRYAITNPPSWATFDETSGVLTGTPTNADVGTTTDIVITVRDRDTGGLSASLPAFSIEVTNVNDAPTITGTPDPSVTQGAAYSFTPGGGDVDVGDTLVYAISNPPSWASFDTATGALTGTPANADVGNYENIVISVTDGIIATPVALPTFAIAVTNTNDAPTISGTPATSVAEDSAYSFTPTAEDADGDMLTWAITNMPSWASFDTATGALTGTPANADVGNYENIVISVTDGIIATPVELPAFAIEVTNTNDAPTITGTPDPSVTQGAAYSFTPGGGDVDVGDTLVYAISNPPSWASFDTATGALTGTPANADVGNYENIVITVTDGIIATPVALPTFAIAVTNANDAPTISGTPATTVAEDSAYSFTPTAEDADGDMLTYAITNMPSWASFDTATGALTGTPTNADVGNYENIVISVTDGIIATPVELPAFAIEVTNTNDAPTITGTPDPSVTQGAAYSFTPGGGDVDVGDTLVYAISNPPSWASFDTATGALTGTPANADVGNYENIVISVTDGIIATPVALPTFAIAVTNTNDAPTISGTPATSVAEDSAYSFTPTGEDADGDTLTWAITNMPSWASFDTATGALTGTPANADVGNYENIVISVTDGIIATPVALAAFAIEVTAATPTNTPPTTSGFTVTTNEDTDYTFAASDFPFTDTDTGDMLEQVRIDTLPASADGSLALNGTAVTLTQEIAVADIPTLVYTPVADVNGDAIFTFSVSDGTAFSATATATLSVTAVNDPPTITGIPNATLVQGEDYSFTPGGGDVDGDTLVYAITGTPGWASFDATTGALTGTPASTDVAEYENIVISVTDGIIATPVALATFAIEVTATAGPNGPPIGLPTIAGMTIAGQTLTANTTGISDADGPDPLPFSYQWNRRSGSTDTAISGADSATYTLTEDEVGQMITVSVRYTDAGNTAEGPLTSAPTAVVVAAQLEVLDEEDEVAALGVALASTDSAGTTITLPTSEPVDVSNASTADFTVTSTLNGATTTHEVTAINAGSIILTVSPAIPAGADIVVFYAPVQGSITGTITGTRLAEFSRDLSVINNVINSAPTADAGDNQTVAEGATVTLNGSASSDSEGEDLIYAWTQSSGTNVTLNDASAESPTFTAPANLSANAVLEFILTVNDGTSDSTPDPVRISVTTDAPARQQALKTGLAALGRGLAASATDAIGQRLKPAATRPETSAFSGLSLANCIANMTSLTPTDTASADGADRSAWFDPRDLGGDIGSAEPDNNSRNNSRNPLGACRLPDSGQLARSAFVIPLNRLSGKGNAGAGGGLWSLWGRGDLSRFEGRPQTGLDLDGDLRAGYLGLDYRLSSGGLVGVALSRSEGEIDIGTADDTLDKGTLDKGTLDTRLNSVYPYGYWSPRAGLGLWGLLGVGSGDATLSHRETDFATDLDMRMGALGLRQAVQTLGSFELALKADAFVVELESEDGPGLPAVSAQARRARLLLEASHSWQPQPDERLGTSLELGLRADGGDADEGAGAELGVGLEYSNTRLGLRAQWRAQGLLVHSASGFEEWGISLNVELDPGVSGQGLALTLAPTWGQAASGGAQALWQSDRPLRDSGLAQASAMRMDLDLSYGLNRDHRQLSPFASLGLADGVMQRLRLGLRLELADELEMELFGGRNASENRSPEHLLGLTGRLRF